MCVFVSRVAGTIMSHVGMPYPNRTRFPIFFSLFLLFWSEVFGFPGTSRHLKVGLFVCSIIYSLISLAAFHINLVNYQVSHVLPDISNIHI